MGCLSSLVVIDTAVLSNSPVPMFSCWLQSSLSKGRHPRQRKVIIDDNIYLGFHASRSIPGKSWTLSFSRCLELRKSGGAFKNWGSSSDTFKREIETQDPSKPNRLGRSYLFPLTVGWGNVTMVRETDIVYYNSMPDTLYSDG